MAKFWDCPDPECDQKKIPYDETECPSCGYDSQYEDVDDPDFFYEMEDETTDAD